MKTFGSCLKAVREKKPLIHNITNFVTVNDCANMLLASGASPIMTDSKDEAAEIATVCQGLNLNIGTLNKEQVEAMLLAGEAAGSQGKPIVLDPVGVGASSLRTESAKMLMDKLKVTVIKGNISEIKTLAAAGSEGSRGVDAKAADKVTKENLDEVCALVKNWAKDMHCILAITGAIDMITDGNKCYCIFNGREEMESITGLGCQLSGLTAAYLVANPDAPLEAAAAAICSVGLAGEIGFERMQPGDGNSTYRNRIIDAVYNMDMERLDRGAKYEVR